MVRTQTKDDAHGVSGTIFLRQSHPPGFCVQRNLFYASESWISVLHQDVSALLDAFVDAFSTTASSAARANGTGKGKEVNLDGQQETGKADGRMDGESPFELFRRIWLAHGWGRIHLVGVLDGVMRRPWGDSVMRAFVENIQSGQPALRQIAALFAVYTFWSTQAPTQEKIYISVDPPTLDYICSLPLTLAPTLASSSIDAASSIDPSLSHEPQPAPHSSLDLAAVLGSLISSSAFLIIPTEAFLHPQGPSVTIQDSTIPLRELNAKLALGALAESDAIKAGRHVVSEETDEMEVEDDSVEGISGWPQELRPLREKYLEKKTQQFSRGGSGSGLRLTNRVVGKAEDLTLRALKDAAPAAEGVVPGISEKVELSEADARGLGLFRLVNASEVGTDGKGLEAFELAMAQLHTLVAAPVK